MQERQTYLEAETATWPQARAYLARYPAAVLPLGATEQHGPHLPQGTDTFIAREICRRVVRRSIGYLLPAIPVSYSRVWSNAAGTAWVNSATLKAFVKDIVRGMERTGVRAMLLFSGHSANQQPLKELVRELRDEGCRVALLHGCLMGAEQVLPEMESKLWRGTGELHAEELETSLVLALRPELVKMELAAPDYPPAPPDFGHTVETMGDVMRTGVFGDPTRASVEKGERWLEIMANETARLWVQFLRRHGIEVPEEGGTGGGPGDSVGPGTGEN